MKRKGESKQSKSLPFWSWNDKLDKEKLLSQIDWMHEKGFGGFFMHARAGLKTEYLSKEWFDLINACIEYAKSLGMQPWAYDENGWPSGFVGGKLLEDENNLEWYLTFSFGEKDENAFVSYDISGRQLQRLSSVDGSHNALNVYKHTCVSTVDILDDNVVNQFIAETHEKYKKETGKHFESLAGFFTDEPQYCRKGTPFPHKITQLFLECYKQDILDELGLLFVEKEGFREFRYRYWKACQQLMLNNYAKKLYDWCDENNVKLTGHYVEERDLYGTMLFNAGIMPFYEYEHIPGIDYLCRRFMSVVPARQVGSVAAQLGKEDVLTETYAMTGWDMTPQEMKAIGEYQYLYGVNKTCQHLLPYSERGERKRDYPMHFTPLNPWLDESIDKVNAYFDWLGGNLRDSEEFVNVAVLHPIRSAYFTYQHGKPSSTEELDNALLGLANRLAEDQIGFHFLDETLLKKYGFVEGHKIGCGKCSYEYLILPKLYTMDKETESFLRAFIKGGGKVYLADEKPKYLEGKPYGYDYLESNVSWDDLRLAQPYRLETDGGVLYSTYRKSETGDFIVVLNISDTDTINARLSVKGEDALAYYSFEDDEYFFCDGTLEIKPLQSCIICFHDTRKEKEKKQIIVVDDKEWSVKERDENKLLLDFACFSYDGKEYSDKYPLCGVFQYLLKSRYQGELWLKFDFEVASHVGVVKICSEYDGATTYVNGQQIENIQENIANKLRIGKNQIEIRLDFYENEMVYRALFAEGVTESLKNCLVYDTYLENLYLQGDFGVYAKDGFKIGQEQGVLFADSFWIGDRKERMKELVQDGEPFFSGRMVLKKIIQLDETNVRLKLGTRVHTVRVSVNGRFVGECLFDDEMDISSFARLGENEIEIEFFTSARNFLGPHHEQKTGENLMVTASSWDMFTKWDNLQCEAFRSSYSFVETRFGQPMDKLAHVLYYGVGKNNQP